MADVAGRSIYHNAAFIQLFGYTVDELNAAGGPAAVYTDPDEASEVFEAIMSGGSWNGELRMKTREGQEMEVFLRANCANDDNGTVIGLIGIHTDITERKRAEETIRRNLERQKTISSVSSRFIGESDIDDAINRSLANLGRLTGASRCYMFSIREDGTTMDNTNEWCEGKVRPQTDRLHEIPCDTYRWWMKKLHKGETVHIRDVSRLPKAADAEKGMLESQGSKSTLIAPLHVRGRLAGFIGLDDAITTREWSAEDQSLLGIISEIIGNAIDRRRAEEALQESEEKLRLTFESMGEGIIVTDLAGNIVDANESSVRLHGYCSKEELLGCNGADFIAEEYRPAAVEVLRETFQSGGSGHLSYTALDKDGREYDGEATVAVLSDDVGEPKGLIFVERDVSERKMGEERLRQSLLRLQKAMIETVNVLAAVTEKRDPYTAGHQRRVAELSVAIAREMGLPEDRVQGIHVAGTIHDVGKISVPIEILSKPGKLNEHEFGILKLHPLIGYDVVKGIEFPWPVAQTILQHHERLDGSGYPSAIPGDDIILEARILAVADVVEAMASHRPYREALGIEAALEEISRNSGITYDPEVVDACIRLFKERGYVLA
jgi:PAS domain S-box-containing protein